MQVAPMPTQSHLCPPMAPHASNRTYAHPWPPMHPIAPMPTHDTPCPPRRSLLGQGTHSASSRLVFSRTRARLGEVRWAQLKTFGSLCCGLDTLGAVLADELGATAEWAAGADRPLS